MNKFIVIGNPVSHSLSPFIHRIFADELGLQLDFAKLQPSESKFECDLEAFFNQGGRGASITVPFKERAFELVDELSNEAKSSESVNTISLTSDNKLRGHNTDGIGLVRDIECNKQFHLSDKTVLILGAGGAAKGVVQSILDRSPQELVICNRTHSKAVSLANRFSMVDNVSACSIEGLSQPFDLIINATSASLSRTDLGLPSTIVSERSIAYDLVYGSDETVFNQWASSQGSARGYDGIGMLVEQAAEAFQIWHGKIPDTFSAINRLKSQLK